MTDTFTHIFGVPHFAVVFSDFATGRVISRQWRQTNNEDAIDAIVNTAEAIANREGVEIDIAIGASRAGIRVRPR